MSFNFTVIDLTNILVRQLIQFKTVVDELFKKQIKLINVKGHTLTQYNTTQAYCSLSTQYFTYLFLDKSTLSRGILKQFFNILF